MSAAGARWALLCAVALACAARGQAQPAIEAEVVTLVVADCAVPGLDESEVVRVLRATLWPVQVHTRSARTETASPEAVVLAFDACHGPHAAGVGLWKSGAAETAHVLDLSEVPASAAARTVAMALAELYDTRNVAAQEAAGAGAASRQATDAEVPPILARARPNDAMAADEEPAAAGPSPWDEVAIHGSFVMRETMGHNNLFVGGAAGVRLHRFRVELLFASSSEAVEIGDVVFDYTVMAAGYDVVHLGDRLLFALRPRLEAGLATAHGKPNGTTYVPNWLMTQLGTTQARTTVALQLAALAEAELRFEPTSALQLSLTLGAGFARGVLVTADLPRGQDVPLGSTGGAVVGGAISVAWIL